MFVIDGLVQSHHDDQIEDLIKRLERIKREEYRKNGKNDGVTVDEHDDYEIRV